MRMRAAKKIRLINYFISQYCIKSALYVQRIIGASLSEPHLDELAGALFWYIYMYPWAVHLVPCGPSPLNAQRANVRPAE